MHTSLKNVTERAQKYDFSVNFHILIEQTGFRSDILCQKVDITYHCVFKYDFSVNIPIYIAYNKSKDRHFVSESWH